MTIATQFRIQQLKSQARRLYLSIHRQHGEFSCGARLAEFIRPSLRAEADEFNSVMAELAQIDPEAAKVWEKEGRL